MIWCMMSIYIFVFVSIYVFVYFVEHFGIKPNGLEYEMI